MNDFETSKKVSLKRMASYDRSNIGGVDAPIKPLVDFINSSKDYYTTSSCSGRIIVIKVPENGSKRDAEFLYRTHELGDAKKLISEIKDLKTDESVWFRQEPAILHFASRTLEDASKFLRAARLIGFKRGGLFEIEKRFLVEIVSTERIDAMIARNGKVIVDDNYITILVEEANKRLKRTWEKTEKLKDTIAEF